MFFLQFPSLYYLSRPRKHYTLAEINLPPKTGVQSLLFFLWMLSVFRLEIYGQYGKLLHVRLKPDLVNHRLAILTNFSEI